MKSALTVGLTYLIATFLCLSAFVIQYRLWRSDFHIPIYYNLGMDTDYSMWLAKTLKDSGWILNSPWMGAPGIQENYDFQQGDNLQMLLIKWIGDVTPDFGTATNLSFLLGFLLTTWTSLFVLRTLGVSNPIATVMSLLYAFAPYHFSQGQLHLVLSLYFAVPLIVLVMLWLCDGRSIFSVRNEQGRVRLSWCRGKTLAALLACVLVGSSGAYYAFFASALVVASGLIVLLRSWKVGRLVDPLVTLLLICGIFVLNLAPHLWYVRAHGKNPDVAVRTASHSLVFALSFTQLIGTVPYHPLKGVAAAVLGRERQLPTAYECCKKSSLHERAPLAVAGTCGFLALLVALFLSRRPLGDLRILASLSRLNFAALLFLWTGGLGYLFAVWVSPQIRDWSRLSIFIAFLSLTAIAILLEHVRRHWIKTPLAELLFHGALAGLLVCGIFDQMSQPWVPDHASAREQFVNEQEFVRKIEGALPEKAMVFQLPYVPFPEGYSPHDRIPGTFLYTHLRPYLHSSRIHWSFGAMKGRDVSRWQQSVSEEPAPKLVSDVVAKGFKGLWIDRRGYGDGADVKLIADLRALLRVEPTVDTHGDIVFFLLPGTAQDVAGSS